MYTESIYFVPFHNEPLEWQMTISAACSHSGMYQHLTDMLHKFYCLLVYEGKKGYIDVGDGCWKRTVLMTTFRYWWRFCPFWFTIFLHKHWTPKCKRCHLHQKSSPTSRCHQHYCRPQSVAIKISDRHCFHVIREIDSKVYQKSFKKKLFTVMN